MDQTTNNSNRRNILITLFILPILFYLSLIFVFFVNIYLNKFDNILINSNNTDKNHIEKIYSPKVKIFPLPYIELNDIHINDQVHFNNAQIKFTILSLFKFSPKIKSFKITSLYGKNINNISKYLFDALHNLNINNNVSSNINYKSLNKFAINKLIINNKLLANNIKANISPYNSKITLYNNENINITVNIKSSTEKSQAGEYHITSMINDHDNIIDVNLDVKDNKLLNQLEYNNISINSEFIQGGGNIIHSYNGANQDQISMDFTLLDMFKYNQSQSNLLSKDKITWLTKIIINSQHNNTDNIANNVIDNNLNVTIKDLIIDSENQFQNIELIGNLNQNSINITKFHSPNNFNLNGKIFTDNEILNFRGSFILNNMNILNYMNSNLMSQLNSQLNKIINIHSANKILADIELSNVNRSLKNIQILTDDNQVILNGDINHDIIGNKNYYNANLKLNNISIDNIINKQTKTDAEPNIPITYYLNRLKNNDIYNIKLHINKINYLKSTHINNNIKIITKEDYIESNFLNEKFAFNSQIKLENFTPSITININKLPFDINKINFKLLPIYVKDLTNFFGPHNKIRLIKSNQDHNNDIDFNIEFSNNKFYIYNINANIFDGSIFTKGEIEIKDTIFSKLYMESNNLDINKLNIFTNNFIKDLTHISDGKINFTSNSKTKGNNIEELLYNLEAVGQFTGSSMKHNKLNIDQLIAQMRSPTYNPVYLTNDVDIIFTNQIKPFNFLNNVNFNLDMKKHGLIKITNFSANTANSLINANMAYHIYTYKAKTNGEFIFYIEDMKNLDDSNSKEKSKDDVKKIPKKLPFQFDNFLGKGKVNFLL